MNRLIVFALPHVAFGPGDRIGTPPPDVQFRAVRREMGPPRAFSPPYRRGGTVVEVGLFDKLARNSRRTDQSTGPGANPSIRRRGLVSRAYHRRRFR